MAARGVQTPLITEAELSYDEQFRIRRRRYVVMMVLRVPCLILATVFYHTLWLAMIFVVVSIPLPWIAVLVANDRPARKQRKATPGTINHERALPAGGYQLIDGSVEEADSTAATSNTGSRTDAAGTGHTSDDPVWTGDRDIAHPNANNPAWSGNGDTVHRDTVHSDASEPVWSDDRHTMHSDADEPAWSDDRTRPAGGPVRLDADNPGRSSDHNSV